jgi:hypothetical protein
MPVLRRNLSQRLSGDGLLTARPARGSAEAGLECSGCQTLRMNTLTRAGPRRGVLVIVVVAAVVALISTTTDALLARLTRIPLGRGAASITWSGVAGVTPTIKSIKGSAAGYSVSGGGRVPTPASILGSASSIPSDLPLADVKGTIGGSRFTLDITLTLPTSGVLLNPQTFGRVSGTFRGQAVTAKLTAKVSSNSFGFKGTIGTLHVTGVISQPRQHGNTETAHASFDVTK